MNKQVDKMEAQVAVHPNLFAALAAAQAEMGPALKDRTNPAFKSRYADLASVMAACLPALNTHGIAVMQPPCEVDGQRYVKTILAHTSGETHECMVPLIVTKNDMQGYGSAVTYARRYGLMAMAGVAPDDDDGNAAVAAAPKAEPARDFQREVADAIRGVEREKTLDGLGAFFTDLYRNHRDVADDPKVIAAKDARKAALRPIVDDEIPY